MTKFAKVVLAPWFAVVHLVSLIREGDDDLHGTYPDLPGPSGEEAAVTTSVNAAVGQPMF